MDRRLFLQLLGVGSVSASLSGCASFCSICTDNEVYIPTTQLVVDAHAHIFNARDLPVSGFIQHVLIKEEPLWEVLLIIIGDVLHRIGAPSIESERSRLVILNNVHKELKSIKAKWDIDDRARRRRAITMIDSELERIDTLVKDSSIVGLGTITDKEKLFHAYVTSKVKRSKTKGSFGWFEALAKEFIQVRIYVEFIYVMLNYRYQNIDALKQLYPEVDLFTPALIDFDHWLYPDLSNGAPDSVAKQMSIMPALVNYSKGQVRPYVAYDPLRDVVANHKTGHDLYPTLAIIKNAIKEQGAIGIKLYPPMGFRVYNNKELADNQFCKLDKSIQNIGAKLDKALSKLYQYCSEYDVPILAHTSRSVENTICTGRREGPYYERANPAHWFEVLKLYPKLRVNLGHFAKHDYPGAHNAWSMTIRELLLYKDAASTRSSFYADLSHLEKIDDANYRRKFIEALTVYLGKKGSTERKVLMSKLLYGSDWSMLGKELINKEFLHCIAEMIEVVDDNEGRNQFIGSNAIHFLGLDDITQGSGKRFVEDPRFKANWMRKL